MNIIKNRKKKNEEKLKINNLQDKKIAYFTEFIR